jgi:hypothetical protein
LGEAGDPGALWLAGRTARLRAAAGAA